MDVRLLVEHLDHVRVDAGARTLRASGRAWAGQDVLLAVPVLLAGGVRVPATPGSPPVVAGPAGPRWTADFRLAEPVALAATSWAVVVDRPPEPAAATPPPPAWPPVAPPAPDGAIPGAAPLPDDGLPRPSSAAAALVTPATLDLLARALVELREVDALAARLEGRVTDVGELVALARAADDRRAEGMAAVRAETAQQVAAAEAARDEAVAAQRAAEEALAGHDARLATTTEERDARAAERDRAVMEADEARAARDGVRRQADDAAAELARAEARWRAAADEVRELRAKLRVSSADRARLVELLEAVTAERDALRDGSP